MHSTDLRSFEPFSPLSPRPPHCPASSACRPHLRHVQLHSAMLLGRDEAVRRLRTDQSGEEEMTPLPPALSHEGKSCFFPKPPVLKYTLAFASRSLTSIRSAMAFLIRTRASHLSMLDR